MSQFLKNLNLSQKWYLSILPYVLVFALTLILGSVVLYNFIERRTLGWAECTEFTEYPNMTLPAKIDTGAASSSLSVKEWSLQTVGDEKFVEFTPSFLPLVKTRVKLVRIKKVRSSNGETQERPLVELQVRIGGKNQKSLFTLTDRSKMRFPVLIGRNGLHRWRVDPRHTFRRSKKSACMNVAS